MRRPVFWVLGVLTACCALAQAATVQIERGLIVCIGGDALESLADHWKKPGCVFHCLETSDANVSALRKKLRAAGCHGKVSVARFDGEHLPYIDNLASTIMAGGESRVARDELMRALAPYGTAIVEGEKTTKPYPKNMDEWPQYLHGADNNCVAQDTVVGPPRHVQWISGPAWTRSHMGAATIASMVSAGGRLFIIEDTAPAENPYLPARWRLIARSAFNGIELWTRDFPDWEQVTVYIKTFHAQMQRRLVATGDTVYCTPGLTAPVTVLDAATGETVREFKGTERTQEFVYHEGRLYAMVGDRMNSGRGGAGGKRKGAGGKKGGGSKKAAPGGGTAFGGQGFDLSLYNPFTPDVANPTSVIVAIDTDSGRELWRSKEISRYTGCSMALKKDKLVYQSAAGVFCLNADTGAENWAVKKSIPYGRGAMPNTLVLSDEAAYSEEGNVVRAYSLADGSDIWGKSIKARKGYQAASDLLIAADALWLCGNCNNAKGTVLTKPTSYDLKTGEELKTIPQVLSKPMGHDRCFRNFITSRFFINSKTGGPDCMDLLSDKEYPCPFTRATCSMGVLPCNGLTYLGPYACQCHLPVGLHNFNVYYTDEAALKTKGQVMEVERSKRLEKGPAYGHSAGSGDAPWPTYRQDIRRYAGTAEAVPGKGLQPLWTVRFPTRATAPAIADGKVFLAETDAHVLRALEASSGKTLWEYVAGARVDSPPTYHKGLLLFGCRDGWVHCLRASDGELAWRFRDLPDKLICAFGQLESAWPVHGSVLVKNDTAYFCAGRSSYLDGGLFIYGLDPVTGRLKHQRQFYGPYGEDGFPEFVKEGGRSETEVILGTTADVMTSEGDTLYIRHQAFNADLTDGTAGKHLMASAGLLESQRQHREYALVREQFNHRKMWTSENSPYPTGDIIVSDGKDYYSVFSMPVNRHSHFDPRAKGYALLAKTRDDAGWTSKWKTNIRITGKAMVLAGDALFVAGAPLVFDPEDLAGTYEGRGGAVLRATSAADGSELAEYKLDVLPAWDAMAAAYGRLFIVNQDGSIVCWGVD